VDTTKRAMVPAQAVVPAQESIPSEVPHDHAWRRVPAGVHGDSTVEYRCDLCDLCWVT
jgi:hypothetical protein